MWVGRGSDAHEHCSDRPILRHPKFHVADQQTDLPLNGGTDRWTDRRSDRKMDGCTDGWMDGWMDGWTDG